MSCPACSRGSGGSSNDAYGCFRYIEALEECEKADTVPEIVENVAFVYLSRTERLLLGARIIINAILNRP